MPQNISTLDLDLDQKVDSLTNRRTRRSRWESLTRLHGKSRVLAFLLAVLLAGCQNLAPQGDARPAYRLQPGSQVITTQPLHLLPNQYSIYFQNGAVVAERDVYYAEYSCELIFKRKTDTVRTIVPSSFTLVKTQPVEEFVGRASLYEVTRLYLCSKRYPEVDKLRCKIWTDIPSAGQITISELKRTLGIYATVAEAQESP